MADISKVKLGTIIYHIKDSVARKIMKGAGANAAGEAGQVPAPPAGAANRYLRSDGTWQVPAASIITQDNAHRFVTDEEKTNWNGKVNTGDIVNNCTSTATNKPLSAAQGKALWEKYTQLNGDIGNIVPSELLDDIVFNQDDDSVKTLADKLVDDVKKRKNGVYYYSGSLKNYIGGYTATVTKISYPGATIRYYGTIQTLTSSPYMFLYSSDGLEVLSELASNGRIPKGKYDLDNPPSYSIFQAIAGSTNLPPELGGNAAFVLQLVTENILYGAMIVFGFGSDKIAIKRKNASEQWSEWRYFSVT